MIIGGSAFSIALPVSQCVVPDGINGPVAIWITSDGQPLLNDVVDRATNGVVAGPTIAFIDTQPQALGQAAVGNSGSLTSNGNSSGSASSDGSVSSSISTTTISPADASSIIASVASATQTGSAGATTPAIVAGAVSSITISAGSATATGNIAAPSSAGSTNAAVNLTPGQPNTFKGNSADGKITVLGWSGVPAQ
jgi:hypothetical protein